MAQAKEWPPTLTWEECELLCLVQVDSQRQHLGGTPLFLLARDLDKKRTETVELIKGLRRKGVKLEPIGINRFYIPFWLFTSLQPQLEAHDREFGPKCEYGFHVPRSLHGMRGRLHQYSDRSDFDYRSDRRWRQSTSFRSSSTYHGKTG